MILLQLQKESLKQIQTSMGFFFSGFLFATAKVAYTTAVIILHLILHSTVHIYDFHTYRKLQKVYCHLASQRNREGELLLSRSNISILL